MPTVHLTVRDLIARQGRKGLFRVAPDQTAQEAARLMQFYGISAIAVIEEDASGDLRLVGIVSEKDISHMVAKEENATVIPVSGIMATELITVTPGTSLWETARFMLENNIRHLPVLDDGKPLTTISMRDVLGQLIDHLNKENDSLRSDLEWISRIYLQEN